MWWKFIDDEIDWLNVKIGEWNKDILFMFICYEM